MSNVWVPPKFQKMGMGAIELEVLLDTARSPEQQKLPSNLVFDRARSWLDDMDLIHRLEHSGFGAIYVLSKAGIELLKEYKELTEQVISPRWAGPGGRVRSSSPADESAPFQPFDSWQDVLIHAQGDRGLWYKAPMNHAPVRLWHEAPTRAHTTYSLKARTIRITPADAVGRGKARTADPFTADKGHLVRFFWKVGQ